MTASICSSSRMSRNLHRIDAPFPRIAILQQNNNTPGSSRGGSQPGTPTRIKITHLSASSPGIHGRRLSTQHRDRIERMLKRSSSFDVAEEGGDDDDDYRDDLNADINGNNSEGCLYLLRCKNWESKLAKIHLLSCKYVFVGVNLLSIAASVFYLFISNDHKELWTPDNSLLILGLVFGIILSAIAISGGIKEELYLVLTYSVIITIMITIAVIYKMASAVICLILVVTHVFISFYYSLLLYRQPPSLATIILDPSDPVVNNLSSIRRKSMKEIVAQQQRSSFKSPSFVKMEDIDIEAETDRGVKTSSCDSPLLASIQEHAMTMPSLQTKDVKISETTMSPDKEKGTIHANRHATQAQHERNRNRPAPQACPMMTSMTTTTVNSTSSLGSVE